MTIISIIGWVISLVVSFMLGKNGLNKILGTQEAVGNFSYMKLEKYRVLTGVMEIIGVGLLLVPMTSLFGVLVIVSLMSGAAALHLSLMGGVKTWLPVLIGLGSILGHLLR